MQVLSRILTVLTILSTPGAAAQTAQLRKPAPTFEALARQADRARDLEHTDEALELYMKAVKLKPNWDEGWWAIGTIFYDQDKYDECAAAFSRYVALKPDLSPGWIFCGMCEYRQRQYRDALQSLLRADRTGFKAAPDLTRSGRLHLILLLNRFGDWERAIELLGTQIRVSGRSPEFIAAAGIAGLRRPWLPGEVPDTERDLVARLGDAMLSALELDAKAAQEKFEALLASYPDAADVHFRFGAFLMKSNPERGFAEMKRAVEVNSRHLPALVSLSIQSLSLSDNQAAESYGRQAVLAAPEDFASHFALGRALLEQDKIPESVEQLEQAVRLAPDSPNAHFVLATAYSRSGRKADADRERSEFQHLKDLINLPVKSE